MGDSIQTIYLIAEVQENGIIRSAETGHLLGRTNEYKINAFGNLCNIGAKTKGGISDGSHTFDELYYHRMMLFSVICNTFSGKAWKSWKHDDGTMYPDYFIVGVTTSQGDYSYHYHKSYWDMFEVKELVTAPKWDGHLPSNVDRLRYLLLDIEFKGNL